MGVGCPQHGMKKQQADFTRSVQARSLNFRRGSAAQTEDLSLLVGKEAVMGVSACSKARLCTSRLTESWQYQEGIVD